MNAPILSDTPSPRQAPLALWRVAAAFMHSLFALFGGPEDVAAKHTLTRMPYRLLLSWLRAGEAMMRRLLLIEASAFAKPNTRPILWSKHARTRRPVYFWPDKPEDWRVRFRCFLGPPASRRHVRCGLKQSCRRDAGGPRFHSAWPLAERYEALLRVFNNPEPIARRLARRLHATPHRLRAMLHAPPETEHRVVDFAQFTATAETAAIVFNSS